MNKLRELRKEKGLTLNELSIELLNKVDLKIGSNALGKYERGEREPRLSTWQKLADYFQVPVPYLMGTSDHRDGLDLWAEHSGYSMESIQKEIDRLEKANRFNNENRQQRIGQAIANLSSDGNGEYSAILNLSIDIRKMVHEYLKPYFYNLDAMEKQPDKFLAPGSKIKLGKKPIFYDDMHPETMKKVDEIIADTALKLSELASEIRRQEQ